MQNMKKTSSHGSVLWVFLWARETDVCKWAKPVKVIMEVISSNLVTFRNHFLRSCIASVHLEKLLIQPDRSFESQCNLPFLTQPSEAGGSVACSGWGLAESSPYKPVAWMLLGVKRTESWRPQPVSNATSLVAISTQSCLEDCPHKAGQINYCLLLR